MIPRRRTVAEAAVLLVPPLLALLVYRGVGGHDFVAFDDDLYVSGNRWVTGGLTPRGVLWAFTTFHAGYWIPLTWVTYMADATLGGGSPGTFHLTNLLLHAAVCLLLALVLRRLTGRRLPAVAVASLLAVHPLHVESVAWITERKDGLSALFLVLSLAAWRCYVAAPSPRRMAAVALPFALGLMAKPMLVTLPVLLLLLDVWPLGRMAGEGGRPPGGAGWARLLAEKTPLLLLSLLAGGLTLVAQGQMAMATLERMGVGERLANAPVAILWYLGALPWPTDLRVIRLLPQGGHPPLLGLGAGAVLVLAAVVAAAALPRRPWLAVGYGWYLTSILPVSGLLQAGFQSTADRFAYIPSWGIYLLVAAAAATIPGRRWRRRAVTLLGGVVLLLALVARRQTGVWEGSERLFGRVLAGDPGNWIAHQNLAGVLAARGDQAAAVEHYARALEARPRLPMARINYARSLAALGRHQEAATQYREALALVPDMAEAWVGLGISQLARGRPGEAEEAFRRALAVRPGYDAAHYDLGLLLERQGRLAEARAHYRRTLELNPSFAPVRERLGRLGG
jgi:tetratricopeptide (TPR) repeat protein